jgi:NAD+ kinase
MKVLLVAKRPMLERLGGPDTARLTRNPAVSLDALRAAAEAHNAVLATVVAALVADDVRQRRIDDLRPGDADDRDLVVTVGGDGTVFALGALHATRPTITVNSDPSRSVGHSTRCTGSGFAALLAAFRAGRHRVEPIHRLQLAVDGGRAHCILNDCLLTSRNPAAVTRYIIDADGQREAQMSSGVWISTASGSTGAIRSAGMEPLDRTDHALLFKVREPFQGLKPVRLLDGCQRPPRGLTLITTMPGIDCYLDGPYRRVELAYGAEVRFAPSPDPLTLVVPGG